jgi:N-acyl homoserine lactone hydrolase
VGGNWRIEFGPPEGEGPVDIVTHVFTEVDRPRRLAYQGTMYVSKWGRTVDYQEAITLEDQEGKTLLTLVMSEIESEADRDAFAGGVPSYVDSLERAVESRAAMVGSHAVRAHLAAELLVEGERMPVFVWTIDHPAGLVLVDTGMIDSRPEFDDMSPTPHPENIPRDVACVINTHLHFDHCGGNRLFPGVPIHVQARELADARTLDDYTIREWVDFDGATYVEHEGEVEVLPGIRLLPAPGHTDGHQVVVVETDAGTHILGGDVGVWFGELESGTTEGQRRVLALGAPTWLSHAPGPEIPEHRP